MHLGANCGTSRLKSEHARLKRWHPYAVDGNHILHATAGSTPRHASQRHNGRADATRRQGWLTWAWTPFSAASSVAAAPFHVAAAGARRVPGLGWLLGSGKQQQEGGLRRRGSDLFDRPSGWFESLSTL